MKGRQILLGEVRGREAAALIVDGRLEDLIVDGDAPRPGTVYRARAGRPVKGMGGVFLDTPDGAGFLRQGKGLRQGETLLVQVASYAEPGKAIPLTSRLLFKSRYAIVTPDAPGVNVSRGIRDEAERVRILETVEGLIADPERTGVILRSACEGAAGDDIAADVEAMLALAGQVLADTGTAPETLAEGDAPQALAWRDWDGTPAEGDLAEWVGAALALVAPLPGGGSMAVEPTRALVAVDINPGGDFSPAAGLKANIAAARDLPRRLRILGLGGQIAVDFAPMPKRDRRQVEDAMRRAFRADPIETSFVGWTTLGLFELQRKREREPLREVLKQ